MNWAITIALMLTSFVVGLWVGVGAEAQTRPLTPPKESGQDRLNKFLIQLCQDADANLNGTRRSWEIDATGLPDDAIDQITAQMKHLASVHRTPMDWSVTYSRKGSPRIYQVTSQDAP